eukprot:7905167-Alexandrium_andersonii.AAC.1
MRPTSGGRRTRRGRGMTLRSTGQPSGRIGSGVSESVRLRFGPPLGALRPSGGRTGITGRTTPVTIRGALGPTRTRTRRSCATGPA